MGSVLLIACLAGFPVMAETFELTLEPGWNLVSVPIVPDNPAVSEVFGGRISGAVWWWNGSALVAVQRVEAGQGYFVQVPGGSAREGGQPIDIAISGQPPENLRMPLQAGWNVLGTVGASPWPAVDLPFHASTAAQVVGPVWQLVGGGWQESQSLLAGRGSFVLARGNGEILCAPQDYQAKEGAMPPAGGTVVIPGGGKVHVGPDFFATESLLRCERHAAPLTGIDGASPISDTLVVEFDLAAMGGDGGEGTADFATRLAFHIPILATLGDRAVDPYDITRCIVTLYDADNPSHSESLTLFAPFAIEEGLDGGLGTLRQAVVNLSRASVLQVKGGANWGRVKVEITALWIGARFVSSGLSIKHWNEATGGFEEFVVPSGDERVVVFVHGWRSLNGLVKGNLGDPREDDLDIDTWQALAAYAASHPEDYRSRFEFYTVRFDSDKSVYDNAVDIHALLASNFPDRQVVVVAHSLGGLISHAMQRRYHPEGKAYASWSGGIARLVTLDTPFHGSPMVQMLHQGLSESAGALAAGKGWAAVEARDAFLCLTTPGTIDLAWDNFDHHPSISMGNPELAALNAEPHTPSAMPDYHTFAGGLFPPDREACTATANAINLLLGYDNDGIVPVVSSHLRTFGAGTYGVRTSEMAMGDDPRYDHTEIWAGKPSAPGTVDTAHYDRILGQLLPFAPGAPGDFLVIDVSPGPTALSYPVSYLTAVPPGGWRDEHKTTKIVLQRLLAGSFTMGSPTDELGRDSDEAQHEVTLTQDFYLGIFEVTQKQWERVMGNWPSFFSNATYRDTRPVENVTYNDIRGRSAGSRWPANHNVDATSFMGKLRQRTGLPLDLPTEAQWEYACRGGTTTALNSGQNLTTTGSCPNLAEVGRCWYNGGEGYSSDGTTEVGSAKVGSYLPNAWGLYDMHGNVWEWCLDWYTTNPAGGSDPAGPSSGSVRVSRGGSWRHYARHCRSASRILPPPDNRRPDPPGLRVCSAPLEQFE